MKVWLLTGRHDAVFREFLGSLRVIFGHVTAQNKRYIYQTTAFGDLLFGAKKKAKTGKAYL